MKSSTNSDPFSVDRVALTVALSKPDTTHVIVYFDKRSERDDNGRVNVTPLKIMAINDKKELLSVDKLFPEMRDVSIPPRVYVFPNAEGILYKMLIEVKERAFAEYNYHITKVYPVFNKALHDKLNPYHDREKPNVDVLNLDYDPNDLLMTHEDIVNEFRRIRERQH